MADNALQLTFDNNALLPELFGEQNATLGRLEKSLNVSVASRGNTVSISGEPGAVEACGEILNKLYARLAHGGTLSKGDIDAAIRMHGAGERQLRLGGIEPAIKTPKKSVVPYTHAQGDYIDKLHEHELTFALGPAGTGKTYLAVAMAVNMFVSRRIERIILSRPAVEAGEKLGFLPGDLKEKIDPYLRPLYDALYEMLPPEKVIHYLENGEIEVAPLAFMRGRTLANAFIILDEAQNSTATQMKMFLTRLGENSRMVITGDLSQTDLPRDVKSGLRDAVQKLEAIPEIGVVRFDDADVVRHPLAAKIVQAYEEWDRNKEKQRDNRHG